MATRKGCLFARQTRELVLTLTHQTTSNDPIPQTHPLASHRALLSRVVGLHLRNANCQNVRNADAKNPRKVPNLDYPSFHHQRRTLRNLLQLTKSNPPTSHETHNQRATPTHQILSARSRAHLQNAQDPRLAKSRHHRARQTLPCLVKQDDPET